MYKYNAELVRVIDGDTVELDIDLGFHITARQIVRLLGVDAPETRTKDLGEKARGFIVKDKVALAVFNANEIIVETEKQGSFKRWLGVIYCDGRNLNKQVEKWSK